MDMKRTLIQQQQQPYHMKIRRPSMFYSNSYHKRTHPVSIKNRRRKRRQQRRESRLFVCIIVHTHTERGEIISHHIRTIQ
mmetsp:Transcript_61812/g.69220  ORF Transcript_61812/g.69220 Transcript_61812/m.69220 type:complete len:80 (+) Transcript_61812:295-534(+)